jgi:hypothetical protein
MSRTFRFRKSKFLIEDQGVLTEFTYKNGRFTRYQIDKKSKEGKKRIAEFHSDSKKHTMIWHGPSWFHNQFAQAPYRAKSKNEIHKFLRNKVEDILLQNKPKRPYWW